ncbi:MAG: hypothetical protein A2X22_02385 [Bacteroidetes bacterium GWF2_49_14]|nr:MAG: hypothetical protein A2X22_02385 [Bacteroidetes bacterium GWF2_49_14]HBB91662.1 hypothetical protein [Bacteroidales bacterium]
MQKSTTKDTKRKSNSQLKKNFKILIQRFFTPQDSLDLRGSDNNSADSNKKEAEDLKWLFQCDLKNTRIGEMNQNWKTRMGYGNRLRIVS